MVPYLLLSSVAVAAAQPSVRATPSCRIEMVPADAPPTWTTAAAELQRRLGEAPALDRDCREVLIHAGAPQASVEVTTRDGRRGVRLLADARDLEPTVAALIVTVPDESATTPPALAPTAPRSWHALLVAEGGARLTLPGTPATTVSLAAGTTHGNWEVTLCGAWSPSVIGSNASASTVFTSTAELDLGAARRQPVRFGDLLLGARAGVIRFTPNAGTGSASATQMNDNVDEMVPPAAWAAPTVSVFAGTAIRLLAHLRLRQELSFQLVPSVDGGGGITVPAYWSVGLSVGAESSVP